MLAQLVDIVPSWVFVAIACCGLLPALGVLWLRSNGDRVPTRWVVFLIAYYVPTVFLLFCPVVLNRSITSAEDALLGCGSLLLTSAGLPIAFALVVRLSSPTLRDPTPRCEKCGYNLTRNESGQCPECGKPIERPWQPPRTGRTTRRSR